MNSGLLTYKHVNSVNLKVPNSRDQAFQYSLFIYKIFRFGIFVKITKYFMIFVQIYSEIFPSIFKCSLIFIDINNIFPDIINIPKYPNKIVQLFQRIPWLLLEYIPT